MLDGLGGVSHEDEADAIDSAEEQSPALIGLKFKVLIHVSSMYR